MLHSSLLVMNRLIKTEFAFLILDRSLLPKDLTNQNLFTLCQNQSNRVYHKICDETKLFEIDEGKFKNGASVSDALTLFNFRSSG